MIKRLRSFSRLRIVLASLAGLCVLFILTEHLFISLSNRKEPQNPVPREKLTETLDAYGADRRVTAGPEEVASHGPWSEMGRRHSAKQPFGGPAPKYLSLMDFLGEDPAAVEAWSRFEDQGDEVDNDEDDRFVVLRKASEAMLGKDPTDLRARFMLAMAVKDLGEEEKALKLFDEVLASRPGLWRAQLEKGILLSDLFRFDRALEAMDRALVLRENYEVYLNRGIALCFAKRFEESEWDLWKAVVTAPKDGNAYFDLAWLHAQRKEPERAMEMLRFAARDRHLFANRMSKTTLLNDRLMLPIWDAPAFRAYVDLLPSHDLVVERRWRTLSEADNNCSLLDRLIFRRPWCVRKDV